MGAFFVEVAGNASALCGRLHSKSWGKAKQHYNIPQRTADLHRLIFRGQAGRRRATLHGRARPSPGGKREARELSLHCTSDSSAEAGELMSIPAASARQCKKSKCCPFGAQPLDLANWWALRYDMGKRRRRNEADRKSVV